MLHSPVNTPATQVNVPCLVGQAMAGRAGPVIPGENALEGMIFGQGGIEDLVADQRE